MVLNLSEKELELINKYALKEWIELKELLSLPSRKNGKSSWLLKEYKRLSFEINYKCAYGQFAEVKRIEEKLSYKPPNGIDRFKEDTKYGCYLWVNEIVNRV